MLKKHLFILLLLLGFVITRAFFAEKIATRTLNDFDEARYAEVARNILLTGDWILPMAGGPNEPRDITVFRLANGESLYPYFWKPPLHTIFIAISYNIIGVNELAVRLPSLLFALFCTVLVYVLANRVFVNKILLAFISTSIFVSTADFSFLSSQGVAEMQYLAFALFAIWTLGTEYKSKWFVSGIALGLAIMTKSIASYWVLPVALAYAFVTRGKREMKLRQTGEMVMGMSLAIVPWHAYMLTRFGTIFVERYLLANLLGRATGIQMNTAPIYWYITNLIRGYMMLLIPSFLVLLTAASRHSAIFLKYRYSGSDLGVKMQTVWKIAFFVFWILIILLPFSLIKSKVWWYVFPIWVPISIVMSWGAGELVNGVRSRKNGIAQVMSIFLLVSAAIATLLTAVQSIKMADMRDYGTGATKILASRNMGLTGLSVFGVPYESALFYFGTGNASFDIAKSDYVLALKTSEQGILALGYVRIDEEGGWGLWKKARVDRD